MTGVSAYAISDGVYWWGLLEARPVGDHYVAVTNVSDVPVPLASVCRTDIGRDFRTIDPPLVISAGRTAFVDLKNLPSHPDWPVVDPDLDYKLVASFSAWMGNDGYWRFGTGPDDDLGPLFPRPALGDLDS